MGLGNRVIMRKRMKNKSHNHVKKPRAFSNGQTRSELTITPIGWTLIKSGNKLIFGYSPQTLTTEVVRILYPWDTKQIGYNIWCDNYACTSNASNKKRY